MTKNFIFKKLIFAAILISSTPIFANNYNPSTNHLTIDEIIIGDTKYTNVVITVGDIISVGGAFKMEVPSEYCSSQNFRINLFDDIKPGMSLNEVEKIIGCKNNADEITRTGDLIIHQWLYQEGVNIKIFHIYFDRLTARVTNKMGNNYISGIF